MSESIIVGQILAMLKVHPKVAWAMRINSGRAKIGRHWIMLAKKGCSDIIGQLTDGRLFAIECKDEDGILSEEQERFLARVKRHHGVAGVCRSIDDADGLLRAT